MTIARRTALVAAVLACPLGSSFADEGSSAVDITRIEIAQSRVAQAEIAQAGGEVDPPLPPLLPEPPAEPSTGPLAEPSSERSSEPSSGQPTASPSTRDDRNGVSETGSRRSPPDRAVRVALVDSGVNYTLPTIAAALARGPDGVPLGRDFWDMDDRPFDRHPVGGGRIVRHGTRTASVLIAEAPAARLVPYRYPRPDMRRMRELVEHAAANAVRVVGLPLGGNDRAEWTAFEAAAEAHADILFVASAGNDGRDIDARAVWPASLPLDNLVVVSSFDDFGALAAGVNSGRRSVDYLVPAENVPVLRFDGTPGRASGSSYAVPRVVALAARLLERHPEWKAAELVAELRRRFADGTRPREVAEGIIPDPLAVGEEAARVVDERSWSPGDPSSATPGGASPADPTSSSAPLHVPLDVLVPNAAWPDMRVDATLERAAGILSACALRLTPVRVRAVSAPDRLADLSTSAAHTLFDAVRASGAERRATAVLARDTRMHDPYDGEAFGRGNTRSRPWLADSVWLTAAIRDAGIALAHELFHVLANSGAHDSRAGNLMLVRTTGDNTALSPDQCETVRAGALASGLGEVPPEAKGR